MNTALLIVDPQNDFFPGGALAVEGGDAVIPRLNEVMTVRPDLPVYISRDWHPSGTVHFEHWPPHCIQGTAGAEFHDNLQVPGDARIITKGADPDDDGGYSAFEGRLEGGPRLIDALREAGVERLLVGGLATDYCVRATVLDACAHGFDVTLLTDAIRAVELEEGDEAAALSAMRAAGATLTTTARLLGAAASEQ